MPVVAGLIGTTSPRQSPRRLRINEPWAMRFAAGIGEARPQFLDSRLPLLVHPCFLPGAVENPCMFLSLFAVGLTSRDAHAVAHASIDCCFSRAPLRPVAPPSTQRAISTLCPCQPSTVGSRS